MVPLFIYLFLFFNAYLFLRERERERQNMSRGRAGRERQRQRGRHSIWNRLQVLSCQHRAWRGAWTQGPRDHDLSRSRMPNRLRHLGVPVMVLFISSHRRAFASWNFLLLCPRVWFTEPECGWISAGHFNEVCEDLPGFHPLTSLSLESAPGTI